MSYTRTLLAIALLLNLIGCNNSSPTKTEETPGVSTPITVTAIENTSISEMISFNAVSQYQRKNMVKSTINGYIEKSFVNQGDIVQAGKPLYAIKTKEGDVLSKFAPKDTSFNFTGKLTIVAPTSGIVIEATKQTNDYVSDGEQLCVIAAQSSFVFLLNVPFEQNKYASPGRSCTILLPDSTILKGTISGKLSTVDPVSQTQSYIVKPLTSAILPENLSVLVLISKNSKENTQVIDKSCVLSDETMDNFWVMKLINDTTAVKVHIKTGITAGNKIEILSPTFTQRDRLINSGNYGLSDTAFVNIIQP
ncbi:MAG: efflux RND transporter periplasmic adaptor subunit [Bacteroidia bacterium]|nr:efflux RND transporter periplasmic adaptor subunit [Bacteroidia bacterium]